MRRALASCIPPLTGFQLGIMRVLFAGALAFILADQQLPDDPFPRELHLSVHALADAEWIHRLAANTTDVTRLEQTIFVLIALFGCGVVPRASFVALTVALTVWTLVRLTHTGTHPWSVMLVTMWALIPIRWNAGLSFRIRKAAPADPSETSVKHGWTLWVPGLVFGTAMCGAAIAKLAQGGLAWMTNGTVKYFFVIDAANAPTDWGLWIASHHWAAVMLSIVAIVAESTVVLAVLFRSYLARLPFAVMAIGLLAGFYLFQNELWPAWWTLCVMFFVPWPHLLPKTRAVMFRRAGHHDLSHERSPVWHGQVVGWAHVGIALVICVLQAVATAGRFELAPLMSDYPMYSKTYSSIEDFERANGIPPTYYFAVTFNDGVQEDASAIFERLELDGPVRDAYIAVNEKRGEAADAQKVVAMAGRQLAEHYKRPIERITVLIDQRGFDWQRGTFVWRAIRRPVHTFEL